MLSYDCFKYHKSNNMFIIISKRMTQRLKCICCNVLEALLNIKVNNKSVDRRKIFIVFDLENDYYE